MFTDIQVAGAPAIAIFAIALSGIWVLAAACRCWLGQARLHPDLHAE
jgi:hypothetical protein